jgi:hypothetical protein
MKPKTIGDLIEAVGAGYTEPVEDRINRQLSNLQHALQAKMEWDAARERVIDELTQQHLERRADDEWSDWASPADWQKAWHCGPTKWKRLSKGLAESRQRHPESGSKRVRFRLAALQELGLATKASLSGAVPDRAYRHGISGRSVWLASIVTPGDQHDDR